MYDYMNRTVEYLNRRNLMDSSEYESIKERENTKHAIYGDSFHGETWYRCPHCNKAFEYWDTVFERGFKKTDNPKVFIHTECGKKVIMS